MRSFPLSRALGAILFMAGTLGCAASAALMEEISFQSRSLFVVAAALFWVSALYTIKGGE